MSWLLLPPCRSRSRVTPSARLGARLAEGPAAVSRDAEPVPTVVSSSAGVAALLGWRPRRPQQQLSCHEYHPLACCRAVTSTGVSLGRRKRRKRSAAASAPG